jgi:SAM-dependent methyltransferase
MLTKAREMGVDFGRAASDYARYRVGFPESFFDRLFEGRIVCAVDRALDLGTGTGTVARGLAQRGCSVTGVDPSLALLEQARSLDRKAGVEIRYMEGKAEQTTLPDQSFDVITAGQCWHWFDPPQALKEARRLLVPRGRLIIAHFDWLPLPGNVVEATEKLIQKHNPAWDGDDGTGIHVRRFTDLSEGGFLDIESFTFDVHVPYSHESWRGRIRASSGVSASLPPEAVARFDRAHAELLTRSFPNEPLTIPHRVFAVWGRL